MTRPNLFLNDPVFSKRCPDGRREIIRRLKHERVAGGGPTHLDAIGLNSVGSVIDRDRKGRGLQRKRKGARHSPVRCHYRDKPRRGISRHGGDDAQVEVVPRGIGECCRGPVEQNVGRAAEVCTSECDRCSWQPIRRRKLCGGKDGRWCWMPTQLEVTDKSWIRVNLAGDDDGVVGSSQCLEAGSARL